MNTLLTIRSLTAAALLAAGFFFTPRMAQAHCDTMDGPVVQAAKVALEKKDVTPVLKWVKPEGEAEVRAAFDKTLAVRVKGTDAKEVADQFFFETLVRVHRAGEGEPFTGIKPAGTAIEPAVRAADEALERGSVVKLVKEITDEAAAGICKRFAEASEKRKQADHSVEAGREYVAAYVEYVHYVEGLHQAAEGGDAHHAEGHEAAPAQDAHHEPAPQHKP
jgi:hypothetical protein